MPRLRHFAVATLAAAGLALNGCAALKPIRGIAVEEYAADFGVVRKAGQATIDLSLLERTKPPRYLVGPEDVLAVYVPGILGTVISRDDQTGSDPPINEPQTELDKPTVGFPLTVRDDGTLPLPQVGPIRVEGMTLGQVEQAILKAYTVDAKVLKADKARVIVSLVREREVEVLVVRQEADNTAASVPANLVNVGRDRKGAARLVRLKAYQNDVLHALAADEDVDGLPGLDAKNVIYVIRRRKSAASWPKCDLAPGEQLLDGYGGVYGGGPGYGDAGYGGGYGGVVTSPYGGGAGGACDGSSCDGCDGCSPYAAAAVPSGPYHTPASAVTLPAVTSPAALPTPSWPTPQYQTPAAPAYKTPAPPYTRPTPQETPAPPAEAPAAEAPMPEDATTFRTPTMEEMFVPNARAAAPRSAMMQINPRTHVRTPDAGIPEAYRTPADERDMVPRSSLGAPPLDGVTPIGHTRPAVEGRLPLAGGPTGVRGQSPRKPSLLGGLLGRDKPAPQVVSAPASSAAAQVAQLEAARQAGVRQVSAGGSLPAATTADYSDPVADMASYGSVLAGFDPTVESPEVIKIPVRLSPGQPVCFSEADITLEDGDIVFVESRGTEVFFVGGLLGGGQFELPKDYDLRLLEAISIAQGPQNVQQGRSSGGNTGLNGDVTESGSRVIVLRQTPGGGNVRIEVDLYKAITHPEESNIIIRPGDFIMVQYTCAEAVYAFVQRNFLESALFGFATGFVSADSN